MQASLGNLMVVAHPDDEVLFGGHLLLQSTPWHVVCLTNGSHEKRARQFLRAMQSVGARATIWDYPDQPGLSKNGPLARASWQPHLVSIKQRLAALLQESAFQKIVTHNSMGEYGHAHHQVTHHLVKQVAPAEQLFCFALGDPLPSTLLTKKRALLSYYADQLSMQELIKYRLWIENTTLKSLV